MLSSKIDDLAIKFYSLLLYYTIYSVLASAVVLMLNKYNIYNANVKSYFITL